MATGTAQCRPVTLWLRVRAGPIVLGMIALTVLGLVLPASAATATPSPAGATIAAACVLALAVPVTVGWACTRGDPLLESVSTRPVRALDLALSGLAVGSTSLAAVGLSYADIAPAGTVAARAALVYLGLMLTTYSLAGWRVASLAPATYLLSVIVMGGGEDVRHPALWAWIAADPADVFSWVLTLAALCAGFAGYLFLPARASLHASDE